MENDPKQLSGCATSLGEVSEDFYENFQIKVPEVIEDIAIGSSSGATWGLNRIRAPETWALGINGSGIRVAVLDTGVEVTHPDLVGKMWTDNPSDPTYPGGWIEFDSNGNIVVGSTPHDTDGHGTHTSGTVLGDNASGTAIGVAPGAWLMHALILPGGGGTFAQVMAGMQWTCDPFDQYGNPAGQRADVASMSWGAYGYRNEMIEPIRNMKAANVVPVAAIGNAGEGTSGSPGNVYEAFGIGAIAEDNTAAGFSGGQVVYWPESYPEPYIKPDFSAPGVSVYSSIPGGWAYYSGTSMSTPHVAGTVALMFQANPTLTVDDAYEALKLTVDDLGAPGKDIRYGWGVVDAYDAVTMVGLNSGIQGYVMDAFTLEKLAGAKIVVGETGQVRYTDENGYYRIFAPPENYTLTASIYGYYDNTVSTEVLENQWTSLDITLTRKPTGLISGTVTDTVLNPIENVFIVLLDSPLSAATDNSGNYIIENVPVGSYDVKASKWGFKSAENENVQVLENQVTVVDFQLEPIIALLIQEDAFVDSQDNPSGNYGSENWIATNFAGGTRPESTWLKFDLSSIPSFTKVTNAVFRAYAYQIWWSYKRSAALWDVTTNDWSESTITANNAPWGNRGSKISFDTLGSVPGWWEWDITTWVDTYKGTIRSAWLSNAWSVSATHYGQLYYSKEYGDVAYRPYLEVTYITEGPVVDISPDTRSGRQGTVQSFTVTVTNVGGIDNDNYRMTWGDNTGWSLTLSDNLVGPDNRLENVAIGESRTLTLTVAIPDNAPFCTRDNIWIKATSVDNENVTDNDYCIVHCTGGFIPHAPIYIDGDDNFTAANGVVGGSGTEDDPYIIENWYIGFYSQTDGIWIINTTAYFIIRNCYVHDISPGSGICLNNVKNGKIDNVKSNSNEDRGILVEYSENNIISNSTFGNNNYRCIEFYRSYNNLLYNCTAENGGVGIFLEYSENNLISNTRVENNNSYGIELYSSSNNTLDNNMCPNNVYDGARLYSSSNNTLANNTCDNNGDHGIRLAFSSNNNTITNNTCSNNSYDGARLYSSSNNTLANNACDNNGDHGILLYSSSNNNTLDNNTCSNNSYDGIELYSSSNYNTLDNNTCSNNVYYGIELYSSSNNTLTNNTCDNNGDHGIRLAFSSNYNRIFHNNFINNGSQAYDSGTNYWDDGYPSGGNYWSDYTGVDENQGENQDIPGSDGIGDTPYYIPGDNNRDRYPLMNPWLVPWTGMATFKLENLYKVNLYKDDLWLYQGSKLVVKFYTLSVLRLEPIADAFTDLRDSPDTNYGSENWIGVNRATKTSGTWPWPSDLGEGTFLKFDLTSIPSDAVIAMARFHAYAYEVWWSTTCDAVLREFGTNWDELTITGNNAPWTTLGGSVSSVISGSIPSWFVHDVNTSYIQGKLGGQMGFYYCYPGTAAGYHYGQRYYSKEYPDNSYHPYLEITYTHPNVFENQSVIHENFTLPWRVVPENENVAHPSGIGVKMARLDLTGDNTENVISTIAIFVTNRDALWGRLMEIRRRWPYAPQPERDELWNEIMGIRSQWPYAPT